MEETDKSEPYRRDLPVRDDEIDNSFKYEIANQVGGEGLLNCLKCGACSGGCPVSAVIDYRPRKVLGNVLLGMKDEVLASEVNFTDVVTVLRNMASREGNAAPGYVKMAEMVMKNGRVTARTSSVDRMREKLGLPPIQVPDVEQLGKIMKAGGLVKVIEANKKKEDDAK